MNLFGGLNEEIKRLNSDVSNAANSEKAKKLRKKLLSIGLTMAIIGFVGVIVCLVLFVTAGFDDMGAARIIPFVLFVPCGILGGIGFLIASLGFKIVVTGYTTQLIDDTVGNNCPQCGDRIDNDEVFCSKCGCQVRKECQNCKAINSYKDNFCKKCGKEL